MVLSTGRVLLQVGSTRRQAKQALFNQDFATLSADARALQYPAACANDRTQGNIPTQMAHANTKCTAYRL